MKFSERIDIDFDETALGATIRLNALMQSSVEERRSALGGDNGASASTPKGPGATRLQFPKRS